MTPDLSQRLEKVRHCFLSELEVRHTALSEAFATFQTGSHTAEPVQQVCAVAHKIAGTAGTLGFVELGKQAALTEDLIRERDDETASLSADILSEIGKLIELAAEPR